MAQMKSKHAECDGCGREDDLAEFRAHFYCYECWHPERERTPPYHVRSRKSPGCFSHGAGIPVVYTYEEAVERAREMGGDFEPVAASSWTGVRVTHPGYMARRRAFILGDARAFKPEEDYTGQAEDES